MARANMITSQPWITFSFRRLILQIFRQVILSGPDQITEGGYNTSPSVGQSNTLPPGTEMSSKKGPPGREEMGSNMDRAPGEEEPAGARDQV